MTKRLLLSLSLGMLFLSPSMSQQYTMKIKVSSTETMELLEEIKKLFDPATNLSFTISTVDPEATFADMYTPEPYDDKYLANNSKALNADTTNSVYLNNLGNYYNAIGQTATAQSYFARALRHLSVKHCNNDSALYYSLRGMLKLNMGLDSATNDIERALDINPNDSIAGSFYPFFLMNNRDFKKASLYSSRMLDNPGPNPQAAYVFLLTSELMSSFFEKAAEAEDKTIRKKYLATNYHELFAYTLLDKYAAKFSSNVKIRHLRMLADIFSLAIKLIFNENIDKPNPVFAYTTAEKERLAELERTLNTPETAATLNPYTRTKALAFIYLMQQRNEKAAAYFNEAIKIFPKEKQNDQFNTADVYDALTALYFFTKDTAGERKMRMRKINDMPLGRKDVTDYYGVAVGYFHAGDNYNAKKWVAEALQADSSHFNTLRLLSHLSYLDANPAVEKYAQEAAQYIRSGDDQYNLVMQFAMYQLITGDAAAAFGNINVARQSLEGTPCELCDKLVEKYIVVSK